MTSESDQVLPMQLYHAGGASVKQQPVFRSNGEYEWKWMNRGNAAGQRNLLSDGNGTFYYYDYSNIIHAIGPNNELKWMSVPLKNEIVSMWLTNNGNIIVRAQVTKSTVHVIGKDEIPAKSDHVLLLNRDGQTLLDITLINPNDNFLFSINDHNRIVLLTLEGIVSYDLYGHKQWTYRDEIKISKDKLGQIFTNVMSFELKAGGMVTLLTREGQYITIDSKGQRVSAVKAVQKTIKIGGTNYIMLQGEDGLYWQGDKRLTEEEFRAEIENRPPRPKQTVRTVVWSGRSYSNTSEDNALVAKDQEGNILWTYFTPDSQYGYPTNIVCNENGDVYFTDFGGNIYGLDAQGNELFRLIRNNKSLTSSELAVTPDGGLLGRTGEIGMFRIGKRSIGVSVNGESVSFEQQPLLMNGTTMVPFRPVFEKLGLHVDWNETTRTIQGSKEGMDIRLELGQTEVTVNGERTVLSAAPEIINGTTYVPLRFVGEALKLQVEWDGMNREVRIGSPDQLAKQAVVRFMKHVEQGDDFKATADLSDSSQSINERVPALAPFFKRKQWMSDIQSMTAVESSEDTIIVNTIQRDRSYNFEEIREQVQNHWYQVKRTPDGQWKLEDADLFQRETIFQEEHEHEHEK
ncbi:stalk domain-containing protein [Paenibacillus allorhizosphaerae]|uniref:copper amine oxidase N-terminal domain-containing protein n=1 Tax=Paenibacillus allorhizosphaerae TaxID=2849866 RepID=UPI001C40256E|nr:copper amine oxidase N-terminal domain-containing protein [Paenibacillus allorhizosphaerae]